MLSCYMEQEDVMLKFAKERDDAYTKAVLNDDWEPVKAYCKEYGVPIPEDERIMKAGVYKGIQYCTNIPDEVKREAAAKCLRLGFSPIIRYLRGEE